MTKDLKLTKVVTPIRKAEETYEEAILRHLDEVPDEMKSEIPKILMVASITNTGVLYQILTGNSMFEALGALEFLKNYIIVDFVGD